MASVVGKTIFSDGKGKLFFGYYKDNDAVEFVDYKTWKKLSFKDVSKGDTNKERVIKAIVKNQKQFNKKVDFNMWAKQKKRTFEETMDWFIQNGWISNVTKRGIKESVDVLSVNEVTYDNAMADFNKELEKNSEVRKAAKHYKKSTKDVVKALQSKIKVNRYSDKSIKQISIDYKEDGPLSSKVSIKLSKDYKQNESVNEDRNSNMFYVLYQKKGVFGKPVAAGYKDRKDAEKFAKSLGNNHNTMILDKQSMKNVKGVDVKEGKKRFKRQDRVGSSKYTISYHDGKKKHKDGSDFFDIKIFKNKKDLSDFVGSLVKQGYKVTNESVNESQIAKKDAEHMERNLRGKGEREVKSFVDRVYKFHSKDIRKYMVDAFLDYQKGKISKKEFVSVLGDLHESVNESASKEAMGIAGFTGTRGSAVEDFITKNELNGKKLFNFIRKGSLKDRMDFVTALAGKPGNPIQKKVIKMFGESVDEGILQDREKQIKALPKGARVSGGGYGPFIKTGSNTFKSPKGQLANSQAVIKLLGAFGDFKIHEDKGEVEKIKKQVGNNEIKFYDALSKVEKRLGSKYPKFLDTALKQLKQNPAKFKTNADKEEAIFQSVK